MVINAQGNQNRSRKPLDSSKPPWMTWKGTRAALIQRFITTYCIPQKGFGAGQPMQLAQFQRDAIDELFTPGIRTGEFSMGRGNGKSSLIAAIGLASLCLEPFTPQIPLIATKLRQIEMSCYNVAVQMAKAHPAIGDRLLSYQAMGGKALKTYWNAGEMFPMSSETDGLQGLDPSLALVDEVGFVSCDSWNAMKMASGKRPDSLVLGLGTTGDTDSALYELHTLFEQGTFLPNHCRINYSAPDGDHRDESLWGFANPALAEGFLDIEALRGDVVSSSEAAFRHFRLNQWVEDIADTSWLGPNAMGLWMRNADIGYQWDASIPAYAGVDVGLYHDSSAVVIVQQRPDGRWHAKSRIWWPDGSGVTPFDEIREHIRSIPTLMVCAYDQRFFADSAAQLSDSVMMLDVPQTMPRMVPAIGRLYRCIVDGTMTHDGAPDFASQVCSAVARHSETGFVLSKSKSKKKIDAAVACALALSVTGTDSPLDDDAFAMF